MKSIVFFIFLFCAFHVWSQSDPCLDKVLNIPGKWGEVSRTEKAGAAELAIQKKFLEAINASLQQNYIPRHLQVDRSYWHEPLRGNRPVTSYGLTFYGMHYSCSGDKMVLNDETSTTMRIQFNQFNDAELYEISNDEILTGFHKLSRGLPEEVKPGIWQFPDQRSALGFGVEGNSKFWLVTHDGNLPWSYVTRAEFLAKRKISLQKQMAAEEPRLKEQLEKWEMMKKYEQQNGDPQKLAAFINSTYNPGVERDRANYKKAMEEWQIAIRRVDEQLKAGATELAKKAIVVRSETNFRDYDFAEKVVPFAEVLVKPNPAYFNRALGRSIPQFIGAEIVVNPKDVVAARFAEDMQSALHLEYLKSFIGRTVPGPNPGKPAVLTASSQKPASNPDVPSESSSIKSPSQKSTPTNAAPANNATPTGTSQKPSGKTSALLGILSAPAGASVTLTYNGGNEVTTTSAKNGKSMYSSVPVSFAKPISDGSALKVEVKKLPPGMKAVIYQGGGSAPEENGNIRVAVDYKYDLITRSSDDKVFSSFYESFSPAVGGYKGEEGRYIAFISLTKNLDGSDGKYRQVFWRDRNTGMTKMISRASSGDQGNGDSYEPSISADGQTVVFESKAVNLVPGDNNNAKDIFVWRASTNTVELVSRSGGGGMADSESFDAMVSGNGQYVVFTSSANNLSSTPKGRSVSNIFVRDLIKNSTEMISVDPALKTGGNGYKGSISFDGSRITFCSASGTLAPNDNNNIWDIFLWQHGQPVLKRVSLTHDGKERNGGSESASRQVASALSGDGRFVAFATTASNMVSADNNNFQDVFVVNVDNGTVSVASFLEGGQPSNGDSPIDQGERVAISYDGTWVAFPTKATNLGVPGSNVILFNRDTGKKHTVSDVQGSYVGRPAISHSGGYVVFGKGTNLDNRYSQSGIFAYFTGLGPCRDCK